ncbi:MAG: alginate export family protein [Candidatus Omnitrophica bacterium]|nr:alginate export family protein [Candidatus Omnitrophota bacterium]
MKVLRILCVLALTLCVTASVYAETQSVKVSGDLTMRGIYRNQYDLLSSEVENQYGDNSNQSSTEQSWAMTVAAVQVDADLTDNVTTVIRVLNQRDWNVTDRLNERTQAAAGLSTAPAYNSDEFDVMIDLAYVQLKNFIYSPLTLTIGRQNLWFGKGFIVGANQQNPGSALNFQGNNLLNRFGGNYGNLAAPEYTAINSFDSVKAVLDYDPWTITGIYANITDGAVQATDGTTLWGVNVGYKFNKYNGEAEGYWFYKKDESIDHMNDIKGGNDVYTIGVRGSMDPVSWVTLAAEGAWQGGNYIGSPLSTATRSRSAWAIDASGEIRYFTDKFAWKPKFGAEFIYYSGDKNENDSNAGNVGGTYTGWDPMYRGKFDSAIREFVGKFYQTARYRADLTKTIPCDDASYTNQYQMIFMGSLQPMDSLTLKANYNLFWNQAQYSSDPKSQGWVGSEVDLSANWDYTEDVSFNLLAGWFVPGEVYYDGMDAIATDVVGSVKVSF